MAKTLNNFTKYDQGKAQLHLLPRASLLAITEVAQYGAKKYGADNWKECKELHRYYDAALRHLLAWNDGEELDSESGLPHLAHAACGIVFMLSIIGAQKKETK